MMPPTLADHVSHWGAWIPSLAGWLVALSVAMFIGSLALLPILVARMDADYFVRPQAGPRSWARLHPVIRVLLVGAKNVLGLVLLVAGVAMLVLPGQGLLCILVGASLTDFPGKRKVELAIVRRRRVLRAINWIRKKAKTPPLIVP